jgi:SNF2 family DNA or RNA helicase
VTHLVDVRELTPEARLRAADKIQTLPDFVLPELTWFNSSPCDKHSTLDEGLRQMPSPCRRCGIRFRRHQRVGIAWLYMRGHGLIADQVGLGKTGQAAGLLAVIKQNGELSDGRRVVVVCRPAAIDQWVKELHRFLPRFAIVDNTGTRAKRIEKYVSRWDILVTGYQMLLRDHEHLDHFKLGAFVIDDVDSLRHRKNQSAAAIKRIARSSARVIILNGTPLQKKLRELHSVLEPVGGYQVFGSETNFRKEFERTELVTVYNRSLGRDVVTKKTTGYKNVDEFIRRIRPMVLRRTAAHVADDIDRPEINPPHDIYLDLYPAQKAKYEELRTGVLKVIQAEGTKVKRLAAVARFVYGAMICAGLATLGEEDGPGTSSKLDWVEQALVDGDLSDEKVVVFCAFTNTLAALQKRLDRAGVGHATIWGRESKKSARADAQSRFWDDPNCKVLMGTSAMESSLNLQVSRHLICVDQLHNPARMQQLAGRIARDGSAHKEVFIHNLLTRGTQEEGYIDALRTEQALSDAIWEESNALYEALSPMQMLMLIGRSR